MKKHFGAKIIDIFGTYETDNIAYECHHHNGYHTAMESVVMEIINDGRKAEAFEEEEIVVTVLNNFAMPFIRYNLHDLSSYSSGTCSCGRTFPLLKTICGRSDDYMITADGRKLSFAVLGAYWHPLTKFVYEFQVVQEEINLFTVFVVPNNSYTDCESKKIILPEINKYFPCAKIDIKVVTAIERKGTGKFMTFISKVK